MNSSPQAPGINLAAVGLFLLFIATTLLVTWWAARRTRSTEDYLAAGRSISTGQNGLALAGDFIAAAGFLGIAGVVSLSGFDGLIYAIGGVVGWPIMMFLLAEPLRNLGRYTFADVLAYRTGQNIAYLVGLSLLTASPAQQAGYAEVERRMLLGRAEG